MPLPDVVISRIGPESGVLLRNLFEHDCHDMSEWFDFNTEADGSYSYDTASVWAKAHRAYLARIGTSIAGFAVIGSGADWLGDSSGRLQSRFTPQVHTGRSGASSTGVRGDSFVLTPLGGPMRLRLKNSQSLSPTDHLC